LIRVRKHSTMCPADSSERGLETIAAACDGEARFSEPLASHTTWGIGGPADLWLRPQSISSVLDVVWACAQHGVEWMVLGGGSNVLVSDDGYRGVVVNLHEATRPLTVSESAVEVGAGRSLRALTGVSTSHNLSGPEFWVGIPGTIGGALAGNAGAHGAAICDFATDLEVADTGGAGWVPMTDIPHSYRRCELPAGSMVLSARFRFAPDDPERIKARRIECIAERSDSQPTGERSAGCVFRNPPGSSAGALIDAVGLKGRRRGGAEISRKHANFIVNRADATASDVIGLINKMRRRVENETGIRLETEIRYVGTFAGGAPETTR